MKAIAVDDERLALDIVSALSARVPFLELKATFTDAFKALEYLQREPVDLLFLDIKMPDISGIEFFQSLPRKPLLIYTTAYAEHAAASFEMDAVDYLLKPFSLARFMKGCSKAYELFRFRRSPETAVEHVFIKTGYEQVKVEVDDILYLESSGNYVTYVLPGRNLLSRSNMSEALSALPAGRFVRVHRSYAVALSKIDKVERTQVTVARQVIPVGEAFAADLQAVLAGAALRPPPGSV
ncbi:MAG: response regulator transcription factor [Chitinophagaceae bacterium]|nr:MAG: response regulator transcription factor [Chitinophagaceae bacterium]